MPQYRAERRGGGEGEDGGAATIINKKDNKAEVGE